MSTIDKVTIDTAAAYYLIDCHNWANLFLTYPWVSTAYCNHDLVQMQYPSLKSIIYFVSKYLEKSFNIYNVSQIKIFNFLLIYYVH